MEQAFRAAPDDWNRPLSPMRRRSAKGWFSNMHDAFSAGVEPGGLYNDSEIRILICYLLMGVGESMPRQAVLDVIAGGGMANFFETGAAIDELVRLNNLNELDDGSLTLTETGRQAAQTLSTRIPYTLRERSVKAALQLLTRIRRERENDVKIVKNENGCGVTCTTYDGGRPLLKLTLQVADELQARFIRENFLNDPVLLYRSVMAVLTGDAGMTRSDTQIIIDLP